MAGAVLCSFRTSSTSSTVCTCARSPPTHPHPHPHTHTTTRPPCSEAYGYESWLLGPERGVRGLVAEALELLRWVVDAGRWAGGTL